MISIDLKTNVYTDSKKTADELKND